MMITVFTLIFSKIITPHFDNTAVNSLTFSIKINPTLRKTNIE